ncbi:MAG: MFS transporter, partial [Gaiellaceae bacterium]
AVALAVRSRTFRSLRRHHNYRLFFAGQVVSLAGSWMQNVALAWLVLQLSRSPLAVAGLIFCRFVPYTLLGIVAGTIVDRLDTRRLVMWTQAAAMAISIALAAVVLTGTASLPLVYVLAALGGVTLVLDAPGRQTLTFEMVGPRELPNAVALNSGLLNASRVIGPAIAGVMIASVGIGACFVVNALSFLAVLTALALMRKDELHQVEKAARSGLLRGTREGLRFAAATPEIRAVLVVVTIVGLVGFNFNTLVPLLASDTLHVGAGAFGLLSAAFGAGAFLGALVTASLRRASWRAFSAGTVGFSLFMIALAPVRDVWVAGVLLAAVGACFTLFAASANALVQLGTPDHLRGRIVSLYLFAFVGVAPFGALLAGWLTSVGGTGLAFAVTGVTGLVAIGATTSRRRLAAAPADS